LTAKWDWRKHYRQTLEIESPLATCGGCRFTTALSGTWTVEDGRLVFRAALDPLQRRGPSMGSCCEGYHDGRAEVLEFRYLTVDGEPLTGEQYAILKASAESPEAWGEEQDRDGRKP
jgi:hypothetical protein